MRQFGSQHDCKQSRESSLYTGDVSCPESVHKWPAAQLSHKASCHDEGLCNHASDFLQQALLNVCVVDMAELSHIHPQLPLLLLCECSLIMRASCIVATSHRSAQPYDKHWWTQHCSNGQHLHRATVCGCNLRSATILKIFWQCCRKVPLRSTGAAQGRAGQCIRMESVVWVT